MSEQRTIIITDDDQSLRELISMTLQQEGYDIIQAQNGKECISLLKQHRVDLVILDVIMPEMNGLETCLNIRNFSQVPILMLTAKTKSADVITGLDKGADDYLVKPVKLDELLARIRALLRRVPLLHEPIVVGNGTVVIDKQRRVVTVRGAVVDVTPTEYQILLILTERAGNVLTHDALLRAVWGNDAQKDTEHLKVYVWHLRRKIEEDPHKPTLLLTEWGIGYRFAE